MLETTLVHILYFFSAIFVAGIGLFILAIIKKNNSIMDVAYGPLFFIGALTTILITNHTTPLTLLLAGILLAWSLRLGVRIGRKNFGKPEDPRYAAWRTAWSKKGTGYLYVRSYLQVFLLQGVIITLVATPFILSISGENVPLTLWAYVGASVSLFGLLYETIADWQLDRFLARKRAGTETAVLMTTGLFRYSRRPNYFGETLVWWGLAIAVFPLPLGWLGVISPLLITYIVTLVTGPMLEAIFLNKYPTEYRVYMRTTSYFIPWPPRP
jgi:steroid 5-alpha reductase family enzyme